MLNNWGIAMPSPFVSFANFCSQYVSNFNSYNRSSVYSRMNSVFPYNYCYNSFVYNNYQPYYIQYQNISSMPVFSYTPSMPSFIGTQSSSGLSSTSGVISPPSTSSSSEAKNLDWWKKQGYNPQKAKELTNYMRMRVNGLIAQGRTFTGNCVGIVR